MGDPEEDRTSSGLFLSTSFRVSPEGPREGFALSLRQDGKILLPGTSNPINPRDFFSVSKYSK
jgi:hypothetical protein